MDCISVFISLVIFVLYCMKSREENKMRLFYAETLVNISPAPVSNYSQPFCRMWILISTNLFCGVVNMVQTTYLFASSKCVFTEVPTPPFRTSTPTLSSTSFSCSLTSTSAPSWPCSSSVKFA